MGILDFNLVPVLEQVDDLLLVLPAQVTVQFLVVVTDSPPLRAHLYFAGGEEWPADSRRLRLEIRA